MENIKTNHYSQFPLTGIKNWKPLYIAILIGSLAACSDFVEVDLPKDQLSTEAVFNEPETVEGTLKNIYGNMRNSTLFSASGLNSLMGLYTDDMVMHSSSASTTQQEAFLNHTVFAANGSVNGMWGGAYNQIFAANAIISGVEGSVALRQSDSDRFKGEALFIRGYLHILLTELFGDIPYITTTDFIENTTVSRMPKAVVYEESLKDLTLAVALLPDEDTSGEHTRPYKAVARAVLARAYLYTEQWDLAETAADAVINEFGALDPDLSKVFLKGASGTIWQFKPNSEGENTSEGSYYIFVSGPPRNPALSLDLFLAFESGNIFQLGDQRKDEEIGWVKSISNSTNTEIWYHAHKYKERTITGTTSVEYSIQLRLAEQYLIRAEARAQQGDISGAQADINAIRNRAGLGNTRAVTLNELLEAILQERRVELFTEGGHRWFDLKRMGKAAEVLSPIKPGWKDTDILLPIPESEILLNPNLLPQNAGY